MYHGLAGHFFLQGIPNVIKVRVIANMEDRVKEEMKRSNISEEEARKLLKKDDEERRKWALALYGIDTADCRLYDMVFHIDTMKVDDVVDLLAIAAKRPCFQTTEQAQKILQSRYIAAKMSALLIKDYPSIKTTYRDSVAYISLIGDPLKEAKIKTSIKKVLEKDDELKDVEIKLLIQPPETYIPD